MHACQLNTDTMAPTWPRLQRRALQRCQGHTEAQGNSPALGPMPLVMKTRHTQLLLPYQLPIWLSVTQQYFFLVAAQQAHAALAADTRFQPASQPAAKAHQAGFTAARASSGSKHTQHITGCVLYSTMASAALRTGHTIRLLRWSPPHSNHTQIE